MSIYSVECREVGGATTLNVRGELDLSVADEVEALLDSILSQRPAIVDLSQCDFLDSTILSTFVRMTARYDKQFCMVVPPAGAVRRVFAVTGLENVLRVFADRVAAIQFVEHTSGRIEPRVIGSVG